MIDGIVTAMAFMGLLLILYVVIVCVFKPHKNRNCLIMIKDDMNKNDIFNIVYSLHFQSIFYGDSVYDKIFLLDLLKDQEKKDYLSELSHDLHIVKIISVDDLKSII